MAATLFGKAAMTTAQQRAISPTASDLPERAWISSRAVFLLLAAAFAGLATRMFFLISQYAVNIFYSDRWEFNDATLFQKHSLWQCSTGSMDRIDRDWARYSRNRLIPCPAGIAGWSLLWSAAW